MQPWIEPSLPRKTYQTNYCRNVAGTRSICLRNIGCDSVGARLCASAMNTSGKQKDAVFLAPLCLEYLRKTDKGTSRMAQWIAALATQFPELAGKADLTPRCCPPASTGSKEWCGRGAPVHRLRASWTHTYAHMHVYTYAHKCAHTVNIFKIKRRADIPQEVTNEVAIGKL